MRSERKREGRKPCSVGMVCVGDGKWLEKAGALHQPRMRAGVSGSSVKGESSGGNKLEAEAMRIDNGRADREW